MKAGSVRSDSEKLDYFTLETSKTYLIRNFLRNGRVRVNIIVTHKRYQTVSKIIIQRFSHINYVELSDKEVWTPPIHVIDGEVVELNTRAMEGKQILFLITVRNLTDNNMKLLRRKSYTACCHHRRANQNEAIR